MLPSLDNEAVQNNAPVVIVLLTRLYTSKLNIKKNLSKYPPLLAVIRPGEGLSALFATGSDHDG